MVRQNINVLGKLCLGAALGVASLSLGACSTTSGSLAQGAPITYKVDQGEHRQASLTQPYTGLTNRSQLYKSAPKPYTNPRSAPVYRPQALPSMPSMPLRAPSAPRAVEFDSASVDQDLYKHQRIGKPYKIMGKRYTPKHQPRYNVVGTASWYGEKFHGKPTATGEIFDMNDITAAHKTLPLNSMVYVTNLETGQGLMVRINDRGPFIGKRIIDLSKATAKKLGYFDSGLARVRVQYAGPADPMAAKQVKRPIPRPAKPKVTAPRVQKSPIPELIAQLPKLDAPQYKPLRDLGREIGKALEPLVARPMQAQREEPELPFQAQDHYVNPLLGHGPKLSLPEVSSPPQSAYVPSKPTGKGPMTLTIKGPIHMASNNNNGKQERPKFIPAVNYTKKTGTNK